ncbi:hypothetical protein EI94DRAFT_1866672, partial [Lactarius quietus]
LRWQRWVRVHASPTLHLPHLLCILGPSSLTLFKHVLGRRRRKLIYAQPPLDAACFFCQVAADMCFEDEAPATSESLTSGSTNPQLKGKHKEGINVLGIVTLRDIDMLQRESQTGRRWIHSMYDRRATAGPGLQRCKTHAWGVHEDACLVCAKLYSGLRRSSDTKNDTNDNGLRDLWSWTAFARRERRAQVRARGEGIEGRAASYCRCGSGVRTGIGKYDSDSGNEEEEEENGAVLVHSQTRTTLALLQTFHAQTHFLLSRLATVLPSPGGPQLILTLSPRALLGLGGLSALDARFVERLAEEYVGAGGARCREVASNLAQRAAHRNGSAAPPAVRTLGSPCSPCASAAFRPLTWSRGRLDLLRAHPPARLQAARRLHARTHARTPTCTPARPPTRSHIRTVMPAGGSLLVTGTVENFH